MRRPENTFTLIFTFIIAMFLATSCTNSRITIVTNSPGSPSSTKSSTILKPTMYNYEILNVFTHDREAFTQGLVFENGYLFEGTGLYGKSSIRKVNLLTGSILQIKDLSSEYFGEGIVIYKDTIIQLTWKNMKGLIYNKNDFSSLKEFEYNTEGWGITFDGTDLIMSDGTSNLYFWDPNTFKTLKTIQVHDEDTPVDKLNELEYINGYIYANVWQTNNIVIIDPSQGLVRGWIDLAGILPLEKDEPQVDVLNGIAYDKQDNRIFITGKLWPSLFEIKLVQIHK
jgi:glutaminyl-peptide cyclotransferase